MTPDTHATAIVVTVISGCILIWVVIAYVAAELLDLHYL